MATATTESLLQQIATKQLTSREQLDKFDEWFSRSHNTLHFTAFLILGDSERAECAVQNCRFKASHKLPSFESEGPFRSWLLRLLIGEALSILHQGHAEAH